MAIINETAVKELKDLYLLESGKQLTDKEATQLAVLLINLFLVILGRKP